MPQTLVSVFTAPRFSDAEIIDDANKHHHGNIEKVPTGPISSTDWEGVCISSRYSKAHELEIMALMVSMVPSWLRRGIVSVDCDSKATAVYTVTLKSDFPAEAARAVATQMEAACIAVQGGHNGIYLMGGNGRVEGLDPNWTEAWIPNPAWLSTGPSVGGAEGAW